MTDLNKILRQIAKDESEYRHFCELVNLHLDGIDSWPDMPTILQLTVAEWENSK